MRHGLVRTLLTLIPVAGLAAGGAGSAPAPEIVWEGALPLPMTAEPLLPAPAPLAAAEPHLVEPLLPQTPLSRAAAPVVTGALVDLPEASASRDNPFGLGAGFRHYFSTNTAAALPYIGFDAGVQQRSMAPSLDDSPFSTPGWQPQIGLRAGVTYPVSKGFALGIASGLYYQSNTLAPEATEQGAPPPYDRSSEGLLVPLSVRGLMRF